MNDYSYRDIMRMQEEAKARVMEMQRRSRFLAEDFAGREARAECGERSAEIFRSKQSAARHRNTAARHLRAAKSEVISRKPIDFRREEKRKEEVPCTITP